ncbi:MAG TPA: S8 family serine peptidase [Actinomycetota bacterium]|nr:S8 family serine peptidase [Actinomycetota bacterium]
MTATLVALAVVGVPGLQQRMQETMERTVSVIVRELPGSGNAPEQAVADLGGSVGRHIGIIDGFVATVPADQVRTLAEVHGVYSVTENRPVQLLSGDYSPTADDGSLVNTAKVIGADQLWKSGVTGKGVDVALIDTGVVPVDGLTHPGKVVNGPDLSFESQSDDLRYLDTMGHGTHMAGIIAGRDDASVPGKEFENKSDFLGIAPDARIVSVKVANAVGATDVSQVLAAMDWVVQHRNDDGMNIRVLNLSFGTDGTQSYLVDPLTYAAEVAWRKGIVVVVAAGNSGYGNMMLNNPAYDPRVLAVGAVDTKGSGGTQDDIVPEWSSKGDGVRNPDVVAPGKSMVSLRAPGSFIDDVFGSTGYVTDRFFRGSGTSQAAAVVSGAAALLLQQRPNLSPDQVKYLLKETTDRLPYADPVAQGSGEINLRSASSAPTPSAALASQPYPYADGSGSLQLARGSAIVADEDGAELTGEQTIFGDPWDGRTWADLSWDGRTWAGGDWLGRTWAGDDWSGSSWAGRTWAGRTWAGESWFGKTWAGDGWDGRTWAGRTWAGRTWAGRTWADESWSGRTWAGVSWS